MAKSRCVLEWNLEELAASLHLSPEDTTAYFTDGRRVSFILERRLATEVLGGRLADSEGAGYDLIDPAGGKWEVRSISGKGIYFCPNYMVGSGRRFEEAGFLRKLRDIRGYLVSDITLFPRIPVWAIEGETVRAWYAAGKLGSSTQISRSRILELLAAPA